MANSNRTEHTGTVSGMGFTVSNSDLAIVNDYADRWVLTGSIHNIPNNFWAVTTDGQGHPISGHGSALQILDRAIEAGMDVAYVAPHGRYVVGEKDDVKLSDWIREKRKHGMKPPIDGGQPTIAEVGHLHH